MNNKDTNTLSPGDVLRQLKRYTITGRYGGNYEWRETLDGEWVRFDELESALATLLAGRTENEQNKENEKNDRTRP